MIVTLPTTGNADLYEKESLEFEGSETTQTF